MRLAPVAFCLLLMLAGCGSPTAERKPPAPDCVNAWVVLPGNYIIDLAAGAEVILNPAAQEFALFCEPAVARKALDAELDAGRLPKGDWRIYRLEGNFTDLASPCGKDSWCLNTPANVVDWLGEE